MNRYLVAAKSLTLLHESIYDYLWPSKTLNIREHGFSALSCKRQDKYCEGQAPKSFTFLHKSINGHVGLPYDSQYQRAKFRRYSAKYRISTAKARRQKPFNLYRYSSDTGAAVLVTVPSHSLVIHTSPWNSFTTSDYSAAFPSFLWICTVSPSLGHILSFSPSSTDPGGCVSQAASALYRIRP